MSNSKFLLYIVIDLVLISHAFGYIIHNFTLGQVRGTTLRSRNNNKFYAFFGLPYAEPPINDLRFENPILYTERWRQIYDATIQQESCPQYKSKKIGYGGTEDCLYLNLYTPQSPQNITKKLPVWYFIHPGRNLFGGPDLGQYGPHYIMDHPVIFITSSYRLGALGFLSTEDNVIKGNFGLKDQTMVLKWINTYISEFGGDPNNVVISGESSGAVDVWLHLFSPLSASKRAHIALDLFHRAIAQSGQSLNYRAIAEPGAGLRQAWKLARLVGCYDESVKTSEHLLECLRQIPAHLLVLSLGGMMHDYVLPHTFFGVVIEEEEEEGAFLVSHPIIDIHKPTNKSVIMGVVPEEGQQKVVGIYSYPSDDKNFQEKVRRNYFEDYHRLFALVFGIDHLPNRDQVMDTLLNKYCANKRLEDSFYCIAKIAAYSTVHLGTTESSTLYKGPQFYYFYDHQNEIPYSKIYETCFGLVSKYQYGVIHGEEIRSLFFQEFHFPPAIKGDDRIVSDQVVELFSNFVIYGDPNGEREEKLWKPVSTPDIEYLYINNLTLTPKIGPRWEEYQFWKNLGTPSLMTVERLKEQYDQHYLFPQHKKLKEKLQKYL